VFAVSSSRFAVFCFGQKTFNALKVFQAGNSLLVDGVYGNKLKDLMQGLMQKTLKFRMNAITY
jgi:hypothetical protein